MYKINNNLLLNYFSKLCKSLRFRNWKLKTKLLAVFLILMLLPTAAITSYFMWTTSSRELGSISENVKNASIDSGRTISSVYERFEAIGSSILNVPTVQILMKNGETDKLKQYLANEIKKDKVFESFNILDRDNRLLLPETEMLESAAVNAVKSGKPLSGLIERNGLQAVFIKPIYENILPNGTGTGKIYGAVLLYRSFETDLFTQTAMRTGKNILYKSSKGRLLFFNNTGQNVKLDKKSELQLADMTSEDSKNDIYNIRIHNVRYMFCSSNINDLGGNKIGAIYFGENCQSIDNTIIEIISAALIVFFLSFIFSFIAAFLASNSFSRPILRLMEYMHQVEEGNLNVRVDFTANDEVGRLSNSFNNMVGELSQLYSQLENNAYYDTLTSLPNRYYFLKKFEQEINIRGDSTVKFALVFIDLDNFKKVNDMLGHASGDKLLSKIGDILYKYVGDRGFAARFGGDEFLILYRIREGGLEELHSFITGIISRLDEPCSIGGSEFYITASAGAAFYPEDGKNLDELLKNADIALYNAKSSGKCTYRYFDQKMNQSIIQRLKIENGLRNAIKGNELELYYQVQIEAGLEKVRGFEALLRWKSPEFGMVNPADFIPVAEETGLIIPIGEWVMKTACMQCKSWCEEGKPETLVCVNVSPVQFKQKNFVEKIEGTLSEVGLRPGNLEIEITESVFIDSFEEIIQTLYQLKKMGVRISLDDFGTGYSSLNYLRQLPIDTLKIDKSFVNDIFENGTTEKLLTDSIIKLVHKLDIEVVAEGIETPYQLEYLKSSGCDILQGYLLGKPVPVTMLK